MLGLFSDDSLGARIMLPSIASSATGYIFFTLPFVLYILARWRQHREPVADPHLGVKVALGYFATAGCQIALLGGTIVLWSLVSKDDDRSHMFRAGFALLVPGLAIWVTHVILLMRTNQREFPGVRRLMAGLNLLFVGAIGLLALVMTFQALFAKGSSGEVGRLSVAAVIVYGGAWAFHGWRVLADRLGMTMPPALEGPLPENTFPMSTAPDAPAPAKPATGGLPSLSSGSFPPIDKS